MGLDITITPPPGFPDVREPIHAMSRCDGNILMAPITLGFKRLDDYAGVRAAAILQQVIEELDKGSEGRFNDAFWMASDQKWSEGREFRAYIAEYDVIRQHMQAAAGPTARPEDHTEERFWGNHRREGLRADALRFFFYYFTGYTITWEP